MNAPPSVPEYVPLDSHHRCHPAMTSRYISQFQTNKRFRQYAGKTAAKISTAALLLRLFQIAGFEADSLQALNEAVITRERLVARSMIAFYRLRSR